MRLAITFLLGTTALFAQGAELRATIMDVADTPVVDAVIVAVPEQPSSPGEAPTTAVENQINKQFVPHLLVVRAGTLVQFPNQDNIRHQVYSFSPAKRFELPLYAGVEAGQVLFDVPGPVALGCNIHDWMRGYIYVADSPWFAQSDSAGHAILKMPAGRYSVRVWHPQLVAPEESTIQTVTVSSEEPQTRSWQLKLKPDFRPRRAPVGGSGGYR